MKKSNFTMGIVYFFAGMVLLTAALLADSRLGSLLFGFASSLAAVGIITICKYFYWNKPDNIERYREKMEAETIQMRDERLVKLRDRSGRYSYALGLVVVSISIVVFSVLGQLEIIGGARMIILYLGGYLAFQVAAGIIIFQCLLKKY